jgi:hypothetical protein
MYVFDSDFAKSEIHVWKNHVCAWAGTFETRLDATNELSGAAVVRFMGMQWSDLVVVPCHAL